MNCRDLREVADSFLSDALLAETNHEILRHLDACPSCRIEVDARRRLRGALRTAFERAPDLQPRSDFTAHLREQLRGTALAGHRSSAPARRWLALAAGITLVAVLTGAVLLRRSAAAAEALARDAIGDHRNCALRVRLVRTPMPLDEAARRFDSAYRLLQSTPPDDTATLHGPARVVDRHSCAYGGRRFGHVVMQYDGHVVSLLMTADSESAGAFRSDPAIPHLIGRPVDGLSVVSLSASHHAILLVGDLSAAELTQLSTAVSVPLAQRLESELRPDRSTIATLYDPPAHGAARGMTRHGAARGTR